MIVSTHSLIIDSIKGILRLSYYYSAESNYHIYLL